MRELSDIDGLHPRDLSGRQRLLVVYAAGVVSIILLMTVLYHQGITGIENRDRSIFQSFQTVVETMTTTGYGADSPWSTPIMNLLVVTIQFTGVVIGFVTLRVLIIPLFERTPLNLEDRLTPKRDHVVVAEYERDSDLLVEELERRDVDYVLIDSDAEEAKRLSDDGYQSIHGDPESRVDLDRASIEKAAVLVTDTGDRTASVVLTALEANADLRVTSFVESTRRTAALAEVGVDRSIAPHALIGRRLAEKARTPVAVEVDPDVTDMTIQEVLVRHDSQLDGVRVGDSPLADHPDLTLVGGWFDGELVFSPGPDVRLTPNAVLVVAGPQGEIDAFTGEMTGPNGGRRDVRTPSEVSHSDIIVAGLGEGGKAAVDALGTDVSVTTVDADPETGPDVVGDVSEPDVLQSAGIDGATAIVVTVDDDASALLTVAMARALADDVEILARVTDAEKTSAAFRAGADYVLSIQRVSARMVATEVHGERTMDPVGQIRLVRRDAAPFAGKSLGDARRAAGGGWTVIGLSRAGTVRTDETTRIEAGDDVFLAGSDEAIGAFESAAGR
jgi:voltage-gated potassium channel